MRRTALLATPVLLLGGLLSGCSGSGVDAYCEEIEQSSDALDVDPSDTESVDKVSTAFQDLADSAPEEISSEWQQLADAFGQVQQALEDSGFSQEELQQMSEDPSAVDPEKMQKLQEAGQEIEKEFSSPEFDRAGDKITEYTQENCGVEPFQDS